ncbi:site-2 protease family protein [Synechocystis sp. LKSZ1]|uniref:site-2 protease family protein n=1 Tax=Synechocystis sp. LKSZ1 TaxID=3144951 RepID=UPI00336C25B4
MGRQWQLGALWGIPFRLDPSWFVIVALVTLANAVEINQRFLLTDHLSVWAWFWGFLMALALFLSVLLHELGHSLVARQQGITVNSITLFIFGGVANLERESKTPLGAFAVAMAGPCTSLVLSGLCYLWSQAMTEAPLLAYISQDLGRINLFLALFNLIPGLPLDGGQVLKALVWHLTGDRLTGVQWAALSGQFLGALANILGLVLLFSLGEAGGAWLALIGWFLWANARLSSRWTQLQRSLLSLTAAQAMSRQFKVVSGRLTLQEFVQSYLLDNPEQWLFPYYAAADGRYQGLVPLSQLSTLERSEWPRQTVQDIAYPLATIPSVTEKDSLATVINRLEARRGATDDFGDRYLTVLSPAGAVAGVIDRGDIVQLLARQAPWPITAEEIQRIKAEGIYPEALPLPTLARALEG